MFDLGHAICGIDGDVIALDKPLGIIGGAKGHGALIDIDLSGALPFECISGPAHLGLVQDKAGVGDRGFAGARIVFKAITEQGHSRLSIANVALGGGYLLVAIDLNRIGSERAVALSYRDITLKTELEFIAAGFVGADLHVGATGFRGDLIGEWINKCAFTLTAAQILLARGHERKGSPVELRRDDELLNRSVGLASSF